MDGQPMAVRKLLKKCWQGFPVHERVEGGGHACGSGQNGTLHSGQHSGLNVCFGNNIIVLYGWQWEKESFNIDRFGLFSIERYIRNNVNEDVHTPNFIVNTGS